MKSNQERSNECLPPKKRELAASTLASEERPMAMAPATDSQRTENLAWLASVAGGPEGGGGGGTRHRGSNSSSSGELEGARYKPLCSASDNSSSSSSLRLVTSLPTVYTSPVVSQSAVSGAIHYTQLPPNLQFIASPYPAPYAGYISSISSQLLPPPPPPPPLSSSSSSSSSYLPQRSSSSSHAEMAFSSPSPVSSSSSSSLSSTPSSSSSSSQTSKFDQQRAASLARASMPPPPTDAAPHHHHHSHHHAPSSTPSAPARTVLSPHHHHHPLHPHHALGHGMSHVVLQYADGPSRNEDGGPRPRELLNGEVERGRRFESGKSRDSPSSSAYEARQMAPPSDYASHDPSGVRTSVMLMPNSHGDHQTPRASPDKRPPSAPTHPEKGGIIMGKPVSRTPSSASSSSSSSSAASSGSPFAFPSPLSVDSLKAGVAAAVAAASPHTVIHTTHSATEPFSVGFPSASIYPVPQSPLIGYLAGGGGGSQQQPIGYPAGLPQHLLIPGAQPVIIPVSGTSVTSTAATLEPPPSSHATAASTQGSPFPHAYISTAVGPKGEAAESYPHHHPVAQLHLPVASTQASTSPASSAPSMPPYFIKGSIIQLADGELKRVEELKTEDFIQSAEISSELKIDSSTVERIDGSHTSPNFAVVQFSVGEHRAQVCVEVLVEYPFFVFGQGWSSCCPDRTTQLLELPCTKLSVGDVCISLTLKNLKNGSLKKTQTFELATPAAATASGHGFLKPPRAVPDGSRTYSGGNSRHGERANGVSQRGSAMSGGVGATGAENGELAFEERGLVSKGQGAGNTEASTRKPAASRKRRWSAPEGRKVEKMEEEPPLVLPKPSFIPHELKVSIEGRSNIGK